MKNPSLLKISVILVLWSCLSIIQAQNAKEFPILKGDYLGQTPPSDVPVIFAPGIISVDSTIEHWAPAFSPDGNEVFWWSIRKVIKDNTNEWYDFHKTMRRIGDKWMVPEKSSYDLAPVFSPDGKRLYFGSKKEGDNPYFVEKLENIWSKPNYIDIITRFPELRYVYFQSISDNGTLYFMSHLDGTVLNLGIYRAEFVNGKYAKPELLPPSINTLDGIRNWTPFIASDESYLLFCSNRGLPESESHLGDLYVSFRQPDGSWMDPVSLGEQINSKGLERFPGVSPDGKYLFFTRQPLGGSEDVYWVNAGIIEKLKEKAFKEVKLSEELFKAVDDGDLAKVKALIKSNRNLLEIKDQSGSTPLIRASYNFRTWSRPIEVAKFLIEAGANVNVINNRKATALLKASVGRRPDYELIKLLVSKGADVNIQERNGLTALHYAILYKDLKIAKLLLKNGADINISNNYNGPISASTISGTVLQVAISGQSNEMFNLVIESGAKLNIKDSQGNSELHLVALKGNTEQAKILIKHGIDLNAKNNFNRTALYYAAKHGYRGVAELLIASGADKNTIYETNYGKAVQLSESMNEGEAYIWDLNYSYAVKSKNNLLVFTGGGRIGKSSESGLANGFLDADELKDQKITMFLRHRNRDFSKMPGERFTELAKLTTDVKMVSSFKPDYSKMEKSEIPAYHLAQPNESFSVNGFKVHPIPALAGGMGYLVEVDGLKIFHAGLHISDDKPEHIEKFRKEIDFLEAFGPIDIVMLSVYSHSNYVGAGFEQYLYLIDKLAPKAIYLWGANVPEQYKICADFLKVCNIPIEYLETNKAAGERFHYPGDKAQK